MWSTVAASECKQKSALKSISKTETTVLPVRLNVAMRSREAKNDFVTSGQSDCVTVGAVC